MSFMHLGVCVQYMFGGCVQYGTLAEEWAILGRRKDMARSHIIEAEINNTRSWQRQEKSR